MFHVGDVARVLPDYVMLQRGVPTSSSFLAVGLLLWSGCVVEGGGSSLLLFPFR